MKHQNKGQSPASRRSRSRGKSVATDATLNAEAGPNERSFGDPISHPAGGESGVAVDHASSEPTARAAEAVAEPVATTALPPSIASEANSGAADQASSAAHFATPVASLRAGAEQIVKSCVPLAVGAGMIPLPGLDLAAIGGLQLKVLASLAAHYRVPFTKAQGQLIVTSLLGSVGTTVLAGAALVSVAKLVPFFGQLVGAASMPVAGGVITHAMGHLAIDHFEAGGTMETFDLDVAQEAFLAKIAEAKAARI